jgi:hypothetical protein
VTSADAVIDGQLAGTVLGFNYLAQTLGCIVMGHVSDKYGRRNVILGCLLGSLLSLTVVSRSQGLVQASGVMHGFRMRNPVKISQKSLGARRRYGCLAFVCETESFGDTGLPPRLPPLPHRREPLAGARTGEWCDAWLLYAEPS